MPSLEQQLAWEDLLEHRAAVLTGAPAVQFLEYGIIKEQLSYAELLERSDAVAAWLQQRFAPGERVALVFPAGIDFIEAFFGCTRAGLVPVPLSPSLGRHQFASLRAVLQNSGAIAVLAPDLLLKRHRSMPVADTKDDTLTWLNWQRVKDECHGMAGQRLKAQQGGIAFLQYTSGSTSDPKGVVVNHAALFHNLEQIIETCGSTQPRTMLSWLPHFHDMGLIGGILHAIYSGSRLMLMASSEFMRRPVLWLEVIDAHRVSFSMAPESALNVISKVADTPLCGRIDLSSIECIVCGSEPIRKSVLERFHESLSPMGLPNNVILCAYGLAEATLMATSGRYHYLPLPQQHTKGAEKAIASSGHSIAGQCIRIVDPTTMVLLETGDEGLIMVKGPSINSRYWNNLEASSSTFDQTIHIPGELDQSGYLNTGDLGLIVDDQLYVGGRIKDLVIAGGRKIHPSDVEVIAGSFSPDLNASRCACFAISDTEHGERMVILVESLSKRVEPEQPKLLSKLAMLICQEFGASLAEILLLEPNRIPVTTSGKLRRLEAKRLYAEQQLNPLARWVAGGSHSPCVTPILPMMKRVLAAITGCDPVMLDGDQTLAELGLSSLQLAELVVELDRQLDVDLPINLFLEGASLRTLAQGLSEAVADASPGASDIFDDSKALRGLMVAGLPDHLLELQQQHGDWLSLRWGRQVIHLLSDPTEVQQLMQRPTSDFIRGKVFEGVRMVTDDNNLFTTEGKAWKTERQRIQPHLTRQSVELMATDFAAISQRCASRYLSATPSREVDLADLCRAITLEITLFKLFGPICDGITERLCAALQAETDWRLPLHYLVQAELRATKRGPRATTENVDAGVASLGSLLPGLDALVSEAITAQLRSKESPNCLLASYLADPEVMAMEAWERYDYLRSVMLSLVLAGLDSTGSGLLFTIDLLAQHQEAQRHVRDEIHDAFGNGAIQPTDLLHQLPYTMAAAKEALRLYPPVWFLGREAVTNTTVMGHPVAEGDIVLTSPYVIHRHPNYWSDVDSFRPERFLPQWNRGTSGHLFMPFGIGPRTCAGQWLALYEITLATAALVQNNTLISDGEPRPQLSSYFTLKTIKPINLKLQPCR